MGDVLGALLGQGSLSGLLAATMKYGPAWVLLAYVVYSLTTGMGADIRSGNASSAADHRELGFYLRQICIGVNADKPNAWQQCQPPTAK